MEVGGTAGPVDVETGGNTTFRIVAEVLPEEPLSFVVAGFGLRGLGSGDWIDAIRDGEGEAILVDIGGDGLDGFLKFVALAEGFEASAHEGSHGAGLSGVNDAAGERVGDLVEVEEDGVVVLSPGEGDEGDEVEGRGGGGTEPATGMQETAVVVEAKFLCMEGGGGAAGAAGFDETATVEVVGDEVFNWNRHGISGTGKGRSWERPFSAIFSLYSEYQVQ